MLRVLLVLLALPIAAFALVGFRFLTRGTPVRRVRSTTRTGEAPAVEDPLFLPSVQLASKVWLVPGHRIEVLLNGDETYPRLWEDLRSARRSITLQMYYGNPGQLADTCKEVLVERARAGVKVLFLRDAFGAAKLGGEYERELREAGVEVSTFRPVHWYALDKAYTRSHIRVVVVDGCVGYTGGFGIDDKWLGAGLQEDNWRDTNARFEGPAVSQLQATFAAAWAEATGDLLTGPVFFPERVAEELAVNDHQASEQGIIAGVLHTAPTIGSTAAERFLAHTIASARKRLWITNAYFAPDDDFVGLLVHAAERGADVRILTTGPYTDVKGTLYAGRAVYERLLEGGVRVFEYQKSVVHAKTLTADGVWTGVGTMNFDNRSQAFNDETMLLAYERSIAERLEDIFERDLVHSKEILLDEWRRRDSWERSREELAKLVRRIL